jgi:hypothetical protein
MGASKLQQDTENEFTAVMGVDLGRMFFALYKEVVWVHAIWQEYRTLYGTSSEQLQIANRAAGFFFKIVQDELWDSVLLRVARLTDSPKSMGHANLTLCGLPALIADAGLKKELEQLVEASLQKAQFAREHRHKRLAHRDLVHATDSSTSLSGISRMHVEEMLDSLRNVMNKVDAHYRNTTVMYKDFITSHGAEHLLYVLKRAEKAKSAAAL